MTVNWKALIANKLILWALVAGMGVTAIAAYNAKLRAEGKADLLVAQYAQAATAANHRADSLALVYRVDTLRLWKLVRQTDTIPRDVERWKHDTLKVVEYVAQLDTTIRACVQALQTCEQRVGAERARGNALQAEVKILRQQMPSAAKPWIDRAIGGAVAGMVVYLAKP